MISSGMLHVISPWFKNGFVLCAAQVKETLEKSGQPDLDLLDALDITRKISCELVDPQVPFPVKFLPRIDSWKPVADPLEYMKDWADQEAALNVDDHGEDPSTSKI
ncbi:hypothetical protein Dimus_009706 [Dionaea muscipula]